MIDASVMSVSPCVPVASRPYELIASKCVRVRNVTSYHTCWVFATDIPVSIRESLSATSDFLTLVSLIWPNLTECSKYHFSVQDLVSSVWHLLLKIEFCSRVSSKC